MSIFNFEGEDFKMKRKSMNNSNSSNAMMDVDGNAYIEGGGGGGGGGDEQSLYNNNDDLLFINIPQREKKRSNIDTSIHLKQLIGVSTCA